VRVMQIRVCLPVLPTVHSLGPEPLNDTCAERFSHRVEFVLWHEENPLGE